MGPDYRAHLLQRIYSYMHLDGAIGLLRPGAALLNPSRLNAGNLLAFFDKWKILWCPEPVDIGYCAPYAHASEWVGMRGIKRKLPNRRSSRWNGKEIAESR